MRKTPIIGIFGFLSLAISVIGSSQYTYNSTGFHIFEDWDTLNTSIWYSMLPNFGITTEDTTTFLSCEENYTGHGAQQGGFILNNSNFQIEVNDTFIAELHYRYYNNNYGSSNYASLGFTMTNNSQHLTAGAADYEQFYDMCNPAAASYTMEEWNGAGGVQWSTGAATGCLGDGGGVIKLVKSFLPDGKVQVAEYFNGTLLQTHDGKYNWSAGDMPSAMRYYGIECYQANSISNHRWQMDWLNLTVVRATPLAPPCTPNWQCSGYGSCNASDVAPCNATTDLNSCGTAYTGDYSEFSAQSCNYCTAAISLANTSECSNKLITRCYQDTNFATCCGVTSLPSDCPQSAEFDCVNETCSSFSYTTGDVGVATVSTIAKFFISTAGIITIIVITALGGYLYDKFFKKGR